MNRLYGVAFLLLLVAVAAIIVTTSADLPPRVAAHFVGGGRANASQSLESYRTMMLGFGVGLPLVLAGLMSLRTDSSFGYGVGGLAALLVLGVHLEVVAANARTPPQLDESRLFMLIVVFGMGLLALIVTYVMRGRG
jgi:hypothetical protein